MIKTKSLKLKSTENKEIIMAMTMTNAIITKIIMLITMIMRIKFGNPIKI